MRLRKCVWMVVGAAAALIASDAAAQTPQGGEISLEQLMHVEASISSKSERRVFETPAAIAVLTQEDIRRSGATSVPELLRLVPGLQVARIDANKWAISIRGFAGRYANKLLVLIDGRSVYTTRSGGVDWDIQDVLMEDIERVEVLRGPGAAIWGANAVNGVINVITKSAKTTTGGIATVATGSADRGLVGFRFGGRVAESTHLRAYGKAFSTEPFPMADGSRGADDWGMVRAGFRLDRALSAGADLLVQGDAYGGEAGDTMRKSVSLTGPLLTPVNTRIALSGGNVLVRWTRSSGRTDIGVQGYVDHSDRAETTLDEERTVADVEFHAVSALHRRHNLAAGASMRIVTDELTNSFQIAFNPARHTETLASAFAQDEIWLMPSRLLLTAGAKAEWHESTGLALQPNLRMLWKPSPAQAVWGAVSRALRVPGRVDLNFELLTNAWRTAQGLPMVVRLSGNPDLEPEELMAYEAGYRIEAGPRVMIDITGFRNAYDRLRTSEAGTAFFQAAPAPHLVLPVVFQNQGYGGTYGAELAVSSQVTSWWQVSGWASWMQSTIQRRQGSTDTFLLALARGNHPDHQWHVRSSVNLRGGLAADVAVYAAANLDSLAVPAYQRTDIQLRWRARPRIELQAGVQNLFDARHLEFQNIEGTQPQATFIPRSALLKLSCRF